VHTGVQIPDTHDVVPWALVQAIPQPPQLFVVVSRFVSHPLTGLASQSPHPVVHPGVHLPARHASVPCALVHTVPHAPQSLTVVCTSVSQPLVGLPSQFPNPAAHVGAQTPLVHAVVPCALAQTVPQAPQFCALLARATSHPLVNKPSQLPNPALHVMAQVPNAQDAVPFVLLHWFPHVPQLF
jgi:hypothetical protein